MVYRAYVPSPEEATARAIRLGRAIGQGMVELYEHEHPRRRAPNVHQCTFDRASP